MPKTSRPSAPESVCHLKVAFGVVELGFSGDRLTRIDFRSPDTKRVEPRRAEHRRAAAQIRDYLRNPGAKFEYGFPTVGTEFQRRVWREISRIPPGKTATYGEIARRLRSGPRAVGGAVGSNPLPIMIPCHRVVGHNGLGGFMGVREGWGMDVKRWLLRHENAGVC